MDTPKNDAKYHLRVKCGNYCIPEELTEQILEDMEMYAKKKSEDYAKHYFWTRNGVGHPLGINEYDSWNKTNK